MIISRSLDTKVMRYDIGFINGIDFSNDAAV